MKRLLKFLFYVLGGLVIIVIIFALYINFKKPTLYENNAPDKTVQYDSSMIAEG